MGKPKMLDLVTIELIDEIPNVLQRTELLNSALFRVLQGVTLVEVLRADYAVGCVVLLVESRRTLPAVEGRVIVRYQPQPQT